MIDAFSRYAFTKPIKSNTGKEIVSAFKFIFRNSKRKPMKICSDMGKEFDNVQFKRFLNTNNVEYFTTQNTEIKAHLAERCIKTIKSKLMKMMQYRNTYRWIDKLKDITTSYNNTIHRTIKMKPAAVRERDTIKLWRMLYENKEERHTVPVKPPLTRFNFAINDIVRISTLKRTFEKEYDVRWSIELFIIASRQVKENIAKYALKDFHNEMISGEFYDQELQKVFVNEKTLYQIESIIKHRVRNGKKEVLVKWNGYNSSFNSLIDESTITNFK